ncbi:hypothetical protein AYI98_07600 [Shewanella algae]|uniref:RadC family protein n=1 Tax=Shewanella algae TaxID=38313 RepID=UPI001183D6BF|nr:DNA repair protein RadC [Shewanella algae]TVL50786.1 hypothetical protein AYI98_07600 [Shewanella algae]
MQKTLSTPKNCWSLAAQQILETAANIVAERFIREDTFSTPQSTKAFLSFKLNQHEREVFAVMLLDSQHRLIAFRELFFGAIDCTSVYPREVVKAVLELNAAAVIFAHNNPTGLLEPSQADRKITERLVAALQTIDVPVLDHIVIGQDCISFAERCWL